MGHTLPPRRLLPPYIARELADAHKRNGLSYRQVARALGIDHGYWRRLTLGERCPSGDVAERIIRVLDLDDDLAEALRGAAVERTSAAT